MGGPFQPRMESNCRSDGHDKLRRLALGHGRRDDLLKAAAEVPRLVVLPLASGIILQAVPYPDQPSRKTS